MASSSSTPVTSAGSTSASTASASSASSSSTTPAAFSFTTAPAGTPFTPILDFNSTNFSANLSAFSFGSTNSAVSFSWATAADAGASSAAAAPAAAVEEHDDEDEKGLIEHECSVKYEPVMKLEIIPVQTGEENENLVYKNRAKLFRYDTTISEWKERGMGDVKLLQDKSSMLVRILLRQEKTGKLVLNHYIVPGLPLKPHHSSDAAWTWVAVDHAEAPPTKTTFAIMFKNAEIAGKFKELYEQCSKINGGEKKQLQPVENTESLWNKLIKDKKFTSMTKEDLEANWKRFDAAGDGTLDAGKLNNLLSDLALKFFPDNAKVAEDVSGLVKKAVAGGSISYAKFAKLDFIEPLLK